MLAPVLLFHGSRLWPDPCAYSNLVSASDPSLSQWPRVAGAQTLGPSHSLHQAQQRVFVDRGHRQSVKIRGSLCEFELAGNPQQVCKAPGPAVHDILHGCQYYWMSAQSEYSTDVLFKSRQDLCELYPQLLSHSTLSNARYLDALLPRTIPPTPNALCSASTRQKKDAAGPRCAGFNPLARGDAELFQSLMAGEHCLRGFTNRDMRAQLASAFHVRACGHDPRKQSAKASRTFRRFHTQ